jgi:hypothetical protein
VLRERLQKYESEAGFERLPAMADPNSLRRPDAVPHALGNAVANAFAIAVGNAVEVSAPEPIHFAIPISNTFSNAVADSVAHSIAHCLKDAVADRVENPDGDGFGRFRAHRLTESDPGHPSNRPIPPLFRHWTLPAPASNKSHCPFRGWHHLRFCGKSEFRSVKCVLKKPVDDGQ